MSVEISITVKGMDRLTAAINRLGAPKNIEVRNRSLRLMAAHTQDKLRNYLRGGKPLNVRTSSLAKSYGVDSPSLDSPAFETSGLPNRISLGSDLKYAAIHEDGGTITPKKSDWLVFKTATGWVKTKSVTMPARPHLGPALEEASTDFPDIMVREIEKAWDNG